MRIYISLRPAEASQLVDLAERERRAPKDQAAYLIVRGLEREERREPVIRPSETFR
jgi:hypothetical protein